ncbi:outer membrane protein assembly factor BamB [Aquirhabdus parva]|uniref:Outer membrane protein assembly factor BamB n=1 Tax=Aquirhabdus parva TaxID=2283318 RepID=A0A345P6W5_9GAMM|nr:outer membrane protein assembly factor BamB [Aquirhabdus parva]AXI03024.1 outer membrane protein assembly factor BamB [Aquirhabdus parva]
MKLPTVSAVKQASLPTNLMSWSSASKTAMALVTVSALVLTGCGSSKDFKPEVHKPSKLPTLTAPAQSLGLVWKDSIGGEDKVDPLRPQLDVLNGNVYAASHSGRVYAWDAAGKQLWQVKTKQDITSGVTAADGIVVFGTGKGAVVALDAQDGKVRWSRSTGASILSPALVSGGRVVALGNDGTVTATDTTSGQSVWTYDIPMPALSVRGTSAPVLFDDNTVIVAGASGRIYALDLATGVPKWERRVAVSAGTSEVQRLIDIDGDPLVSGRQLYVVSYQGQLTAMNIDNQQVNWIVDASSLKTPAEGLGNIYVSTAEGKILAIDEQTGKVAWTQDSLAYRGLSNPVVLGRYLVVGDQDGYLHLIEQTEGKIVGRVSTSGAVSTLRVVGDRLLVNSAKGNLSIWQAR